MNTTTFILCTLVAMLIIFVCILASVGNDLEEKLKNANAEYRALENKYQTVRRYCIKDSKHAPCGKYFVVGWLNMMQDIHTEKWYCISNENLSTMGCDMDGDIITIMHAKKEEDRKEDE